MKHAEAQDSQFFFLFILHQILQYYPYFLGYCGIQYQAYSATSPDSYILDAGITITAVNVSSNGFFNHALLTNNFLAKYVGIIFNQNFFYFKLKIVIEWVAKSRQYFTKSFHNYVLHCKYLSEGYRYSISILPIYKQIL